MELPYSREKKDRKEVTGDTISLPPTEVTPGQDFPNLVGQMIYSTLVNYYVKLRGFLAKNK